MKNHLRLPLMLAGLGTLIGFIATGCGTVRSGYESAPYRVIQASGKIELRDYPAMTLVETPMARGGGGSNGSFSRLFRFITGGNEAKQNIAMTTPVFMSGDEAQAKMGFVMPAKMKTGEVPQPTDSSVTVRELTAGRFAVLRFRGGRNAMNEAESLGKLRAWMQQAGLKESSPPIYGYFDPPWTPTVFRRNEVMLRVAPPTS